MVRSMWAVPGAVAVLLLAACGGSASQPAPFLSQATPPASSATDSTATPTMVGPAATSAGATPAATSGAPGPTATAAAPSPTQASVASGSTQAAAASSPTATRPPSTAAPSPTAAPPSTPTRAPSPTATPVPPTPVPTATPTTAPAAVATGYEVPACFVAGRDSCNCGHFTSHAWAQWFHDTHDPGDVNRLDSNNDGVVCESLR